MENVQGVELIDFFNNAGERLSDEYCRYIFNKVAKALHKLHKAGLAHRDIKPENIILTHDYKVKLIDLGYGIPLSGKDGSQFMRTYCGSRIYMAPEIIGQQYGVNKPYQGSDIDIFSFGVMLLSMRCLHYPFEKAYANDQNYFNLMSGDASEFWHKYGPLKLTDEFKNLITHLLQEKTPSRIVMADLLGHPWMKGEVVSDEQFSARFNTFLDKAAELRDQEQLKLGIDFQIEKAGKRKRPQDRKRGGPSEVELKSITENYTFKPIPQLQTYSKPTRFVVEGQPFGIMCTLIDVIRLHLDPEATPGKNTWKIKFEGSFYKSEYENKDEAATENTVITEKSRLLEQKAIMKVELHEIEPEKKYLVSGTRVDGSTFAFNQTFDKMHEEFLKIFA